MKKAAFIATLGPYATGNTKRNTKATAILQPLPPTIRAEAKATERSRSSIRA